ncbi:MAG: UDP-N-acetylmuramate--L-alanine ligase, partial [Bacillota bacterium]
GHDPSHVDGAAAVVVTTDVPPDNPELVAARSRGLPVLHRSEVLASFLNAGGGIAVTGTHGKTTTTSMIGTILEKAGLDPTIFVGGELPGIGGTGKLGRGRYVVAEACESDGTFLRYHPWLAVVTNCEREHLEHYGGEFANLITAFEAFLGQIQPEGRLVLCGDDPILARVAARLRQRPILYGFGVRNEWVASALQVEQARGGGTSFDVSRSGCFLGRVYAAVPGRHMVLNALAAIAACTEAGVTFRKSAEVLAGFGNARRRFQVISISGGIRVVDDYAHHPTEIQATLQAARALTQGRLIAVFQPQRYVRTHNLMNEFSQAFGAADRLLLAEIYSPPGEAPIPGVSSAVLADLIRRRGAVDVELIADKEDIVSRCLELAAPGDTVLVMGAGDIWTVAAELGRRLSERQAS